MRPAHASKRRSRACAPGAALALALAAPALVIPTLTGCSTTERRIVEPEADWAKAEVEARIEERKGKRKATWKPIVAGAIAAVTAGAVSMIWVGFLTPNRPMAVAGLVGVAVVPTFGTLPFLLRQDVPWTKTEWKSWEPAGNQRADLDVIGREEKPLSTHGLVTDADGALHIPFSTTLCDDAKVRELQLVDLVVRVPDTESASVTIPVERLPCGGGRLSLLGDGKEEDHDGEL